LLTYAARWRETCSDGAAERRTMALELQALVAADLPAEAETALLLPTVCP
jgi:hypothetical protein